MPSVRWVTKSCGKIGTKFSTDMLVEERYSRQIMLPEVGREGQQRLLAARVLIVGVGGLGSPVALYLAAAGVGRIALVDADVVSLSNLQRQVLYATAEVGESKVMCARRRLLQLAPHIEVDTYPVRLDASNVSDLITPYDIVVDGCDNAATRYIIDDECARQGKPYVYAAISEYEGQVSVFSLPGDRRYSHLYPDREAAVARPATAQGVLGVLPGIVGCVEAAEVVKLITRCGEPLINRLFTIDVRTMQSHVLDL